MKLRLNAASIINIYIRLPSDSWFRSQPSGDKVKIKKKKKKRNKAFVSNYYAPISDTEQ